MFSNFVFVIEAIQKDGKIEHFIVRTNEGRVIDVVSSDGCSIQDVISSFLIANVQAR